MAFIDLHERTEGCHVREVSRRRYAPTIPLEPGGLEWRKLQARLEKHSIPITECGCQIWLRSIGSTGYGTIRSNALGRTLSTHRLAHTIYNGPIPDGLLVLHTCDIPHCINPNHLFLGDDASNASDRDAKGRNKSPKGSNQPNSKLTEEQALAILDDHRTYQEISAAYNISEGPIKNIKTGKSWRHVTLGKTEFRGLAFGARVGGSKLNDESALAIFNDPRPQAQVAADYGVSKGLVSHIKTRKIWRHATP